MKDKKSVQHRRLIYVSNSVFLSKAALYANNQNHNRQGLITQFGL